jgi:hypothetical protein
VTHTSRDLARTYAQCIRLLATPVVVGESLRARFGDAWPVVPGACWGRGSLDPERMGWIYFGRTPAHDVKAGFTSSLESRITCLELDPVVFIYCVQLHHERALHRLLAGERVRGERYRGARIEGLMTELVALSSERFRDFGEAARCKKRVASIKWLGIGERPDLRWEAA